ncbi:MAG: SMC family ATPase, partial [Bacteroidetes bacterium]|nr:SMC family ATPase [Bacteroidota bacterium]
MVPVSLQLTNFMSYGTNAPVLDFEQFQVACLSGKNGQGKSALLDAMTWAIWGEARKSTGSRKPDDDLLRIGEREMQVELTFDVEGARYRVMRSYYVTASGKSSKPGLELHLYEPETDSYRPLTGGSMRETQEIIDTVVGLDYDTFINSAFLLQGRSDEFTKKRPSERKEILTRILNLSRYEALADLAGQRSRDAKATVDQAELEIDRLTSALAEEDQWKAERARIDGAIEKEQAHLATLREQQQQLTEQLTDLEAKAREADTLRQTLDGLDQRIAQHESDIDSLTAKIESAEQLLEQRAAIERDFERYEALQEERDALDHKNELFRGVEKELERTERHLLDKKNDLERQLDRLKHSLEGFEQQLAQAQAELAQRPVVQRNLEKAERAKEQYEALTTVRDRREVLKEKMEQIERSLHGQREALQSKLDTLTEQVEQERQALAQKRKKLDEKESLKRQQQRREALEETLESIETKGKALAETMHARAGRRNSLAESLEQEREAFAFFQSGTDDTCPTCGTTLTDTHRAEVEQHYRQTIQELEAAIQEADAWLEQRKTQRDALREEYKQHKAQLDELADVGGRLSALEDLEEQIETEAAHLAERDEAVAALRRRLEQKQYGADERERYRTLQQEYEQLAFDEALYEQVRQDAAQVERYEERLKQLDDVAKRQETLQQKIERTREEAAALREKLDDGSVFGPLQQQIERLKKQRDEVGFDPERFRQVKQALEALKEAPSRLKDLMHAQRNRDDWRTQRDNTKERLRAVREERTEAVERLSALKKALEVKEDVEGQHRERVEESAEVEARIQELQKQSGQITEKLEQARRDRAALKAQREAHAEASAQRNLYQHLRTAFGKHGIPSLIIEHTLPEIEERANDLLERLTDGRMHLRLETLRDKKSGGGTIETLEIRITDEQGVSRAYETFSGGEAFRVNFALRLALAQLLAERSGVRIRTLVIDEGFGTQDEQGVQSLVEAIQQVQDDFDKIVVITHLNELKEAF